MEVILKEDINKLGARGDVVKVAEGYGRNYLLPRKLAIEATKGNKAVVEQMKAASVRRSAKEKSQAEELAKQFEGRRSRSSGARASTISYSAPSLRATSQRGSRRKGSSSTAGKVQLHEPLKTLGEFTIPVKLHKEVTTHLKVVIEKEAVAE